MKCFKVQTQSVVNVFFDHFEAARRHVSLADSLNLLKAMLLAEGVKGVVDAVQ